MARYIKLDALVAEIERRIKEIDEIGTYLSPKGVLTNLLCHLDTLETTEVDLKDERIKDCPYRVVGCEKYLGTVTECNGACAYVVDYPRLKELKAKKGE